MKTIWKFEVVDKVKMPKGAKILSLQLQNGTNTICMWAECSENAELETRFFKILGTGWKIEPSDKTVFIGTVQYREFVWHIYEVVNA